MLQDNTSDIYTCRAIGTPLPLVVSWRAKDGQGIVVDVTEAISGVQIGDFTEENNVTVGVLRLGNSSGLSSVACRVTNGIAYPEIMQQEFTGEGMHVYDLSLFFFQVTCT